LNLFNELKRRNVFRVSLGYVVSCWLLAQVADLVLENIGAPDWVIQTILLLIALGFPVVVFFSWAYEVTPEGIKREAEVDRSDSITHVTGRKLDYSILAVLVVALGFMVWESRVHKDAPGEQAPATETAASGKTKPEAAPSEAIDAASIAVLPFTDLSQSGDQDYFSDGIAEEILNVLVRVDGLSVASRTSAFGFKGQEALGIPAIAKALKVRNILEGSVRTAGNNVRITAQLIDAQTDKHLWSQTYDRVLSAENLFAIQDEIARAIVNELSRTIKFGALDSNQSMVSPTTENLDAYQLYLRARDTYRRRSPENIPRIMEMLEQAIELDPDYASAWAGMAAVSVVAPSWGLEDRDYRKLAEEAARRAIELDGSLALPYSVLGRNASYSLPADFKQAFDYYDMALERNPKAVNALLWRGIDYLTVGFFDPATRDLERCLEIDPAYENCRRWLALALLYSGETERAMELFTKSAARGSASQTDKFILAMIANDESRAGLFALLWDLQVYQSGEFNVETLFRALTEPNFDREKELKRFVTEYEVKSGEKWEDENFSGIVGIAFGKYEHLPADSSSNYWWHPSLPELRQSPYFKRVINELGIHDYWREAGFPPHCRPSGDNNFKCDLPR
jgi:TolB-like protein